MSSPALAPAVAGEGRGSRPVGETSPTKDLREFLFVAVPKALGGGLILLFNLILLRHLGPEGFGMFSVCLAGVLLADSVLGGSVDMGILRLAPLYHVNGDQPRSLRIQQVGLLLKPVAACVLLLPAVVFATELGALLFQRPGTEPLLYVSALALLGLLVLRSAQMNFHVTRRFGLYGATDAAHNLARFGGIALLLALATATPLRVLALLALAPWVVAALVLATIGRPMLSVRPASQALRELAGVVKWYLATIAMGALLTRIDIFLVSSLAGVREAGVFAAAQQIALVPFLIGTYLAVIYSPRVMPLLEQGTLPPIYWRFQAAMGVVCVCAFGAAWLVIDRIAGVLLPPTMRSAHVVILVLLPSALAALFNYPYTYSLLLFARPKLMLVLDCAALPLLIWAYARMIPEMGAVGAAAVTTAFALLKTLILQVAAWRILQKPAPALAAEATPAG
jgi:O-antigen/teichoic acid export membrane protein